MLRLNEMKENIMFHMCCFVSLLSLSAYRYVMKTKLNVITVNRLLTESPMRPMLTCFQRVPLVSMKNMDCSEEGDFTLLLLAEKAAIPNINRRTNKQTHRSTNKHTDVTNIIVS